MIAGRRLADCGSFWNPRFDRIQCAWNLNAPLYCPRGPGENFRWIIVRLRENGGRRGRRQGDLCMRSPTVQRASVAQGLWATADVA